MAIHLDIFAKFSLRRILILLITKVLKMFKSKILYFLFIMCFLSFSGNVYAGESNSEEAGTATTSETDTEKSSEDDEKKSSSDEPEEEEDEEPDCD